MRQRDFAFLDQLHEDNRGDRLCHRGDTENGVLFQRLTGASITLNRKVGNLVAAPDQQRRMGKFSAVEIFRLKIRGYALQPVGKEAKLCGVRCCQHISAKSVPKVGG